MEERVEGDAEIEFEENMNYHLICIHSDDRMSETFKKYIIYLGFLLGGIGLYAGVIDQVNNIFTLATFNRAVGVTVLILVLWVCSYFWVKRKPILDGSRLVEIGAEAYLAAIGILLAAWTPILYQWIVPPDSLSLKNTSLDISSKKPIDSCVFPSTFDSTKLYIVITRFEDYGNAHETECYGRSIEARISMLRDSYNLPIKVCYLENHSPNQSEDADSIRDRHNADIVIWGRLSNTNSNCEASGFCINYGPSEKLIKYAGGNVPKKVDLFFQHDISDTKINGGKISMGEENFDAWLTSMLNLKIGKKKPEFYRISSDWSSQRQAKEYFTRGCLFSKINLFDKAINDFTLALEFEPRHVESYLSRGNVYTDLAKYDEAILNFTKAIEFQPDNTDAYVNRGLARLRLEKFDLAMLDFNKSIEIEPNDSKAYKSRALARCMNGEFEIAILDFKKSFELSPKDVEACYDLGVVYRLLHQNKSANQAFNKTIEIDPNYAIAYNGRGNIKADLKQYEAAILDYDKTIELQPNFVDAYSGRAYAKFKLGKFESAIIDYTKSINLKPNIGIDYYNRGISKSTLGQNESAVADLTKAINLLPNNADIYKSRGKSRYSLGQNEAALEDLNQAIDLKPNDAELYSIRGAVKYSLGQNEAAIIDLNQSIKFNSNNANFYNTRGFIKYSLGQNEAAIADYTQSIELEKGNKHAYKNRANAYWKEGKVLYYLKDTFKLLLIKSGGYLYIFAIVIIVGFFFRRYIWRSIPSIIFKFFKRPAHI